MSKLSPRQMQVLAGVAEGKPNKQIAATLGLSHHTIGTHLKIIYQRMGVQSRAHATALYVRHTATA